MGNTCNHCSWCKEHYHKKPSEDFDIKRTDYPSPFETSPKSLNLSDPEAEKSELLISESVSSIDFYPNSLDTSSKDLHPSNGEILHYPKQTLSLNTLNELTDNEINEYLASNLMDTEDFSRINLTIPGNSSIDILLRPQTHANTETVYRGESDSEGRPHGRGIRIDESGKYIGYFYEGVPHGMGRLVTPSGDIYQGEFHKGKLHGNAIYISRDGGTFEGYFKKGLLTGSGKEVWLNGTEYEGEYLKNMHHGTGKLKFIDGSIYMGEFNSDRADGKGRKVWEDNSYYEGEWKDNCMHGYGEYYWSNGKTFQGSFENNLMKGYGKLTLSSSKVVEGEWNQQEDRKIIFYDHTKNKEIVIEEADLSELEQE